MWLLPDDVSRLVSFESQVTNADNEPLIPIAIARFPMIVWQQKTATAYRDLFITHAECFIIRQKVKEKSQ